ncbi:hypothetical protein H0E87_015100 [Populus deltoides]|uniref:Uncharacterized protein n=1 Tax=Populus deltoides TaxID=3696 RepID=A0A8T2Y3V9_POPDE|nr:hypothetical protein H0E87_015100 [Populus deltoides]
MQQDGYCDMLLLTVHVAINEASVLASLIILNACDNDGQQSLLRRYPAILQTPMSAGGVIDSYVWNFSRNGIYTVRSGYGGAEHLLTTSNGQTSSGKSSHSDSANHIWKEIWRF